MYGGGHFDRFVHLRLLAIGSHAFAPLEALACMRVPNNMPLGSPLPLTVATFCDVNVPKIIDYNAADIMEPHYLSQYPALTPGSVGCTVPAF
jgi:hypothetical protein